MPSPGGPTVANRASRGGRIRSKGSTADRLRRIDEYYREEADGLLEQIEKGTAPWTQAGSRGRRPCRRTCRPARPTAGQFRVADVRR